LAPRILDVNELIRGMSVLLRRALGEKLDIEIVGGAGLWRVEAHVRIGNEASERVLERAGFTREGTKRRFLRHGRERVDATVFSLLADE